MSKILYSASTISHINNFHLDYIEALRRDGHEVLVMARGKGADFDIPFEKKLLSYKNARCRKEIKAILKREKFDAILLNTSLAAFHIRLAISGKDRPRVANLVHGYLFSKDTGKLKRLAFLLCEKIFRHKTDSIIVMNSEDFEIATKNRLSRGEIYNSLGMGVKRKPVNTENVENLKKASEGQLVISFVGELSSRKNQEFLISAMPAVLKRMPNASLWLIGDGAERGNLEALSSSLGVGENVRFFGQVPNPCDFISASDLYVSASKIEGLPFNILEAMSIGKPVLISDIKGHSDIVLDGETGFLYPLNDLDAFTKKLAAFCNGIGVDSKKVEAAFEKYSYENVFSDTLFKIKESLGV